MTNHQRIGSISNAHAGREFEIFARAYFAMYEGLHLQPGFPVHLGHAGATKSHRFDLGSDHPAVLVECKSHNWTVTGNMPSAKVTVWNEAMYYFHLAPSHYRKVLFVLDARHPRQGQSLAEFYIRTCCHLIPPGVSIIEYNTESRVARHVTASQERTDARSPLC
jgi:hypothetical protein